MEEKIIRIIPFNGDRGKYYMWSGKFFSRAVRLVHYIILMGIVGTPADKKEENNKEDDILK